MHILVVSSILGSSEDTALAYLIKKVANTEKQVYIELEE